MGNAPARQRSAAGEQRKLLLAAAVLGRRTTVDDVAALAEASSDRVAALLERGSSALSIAPQDGSLEWIDEAEREAVLSSVPAVLRSAVHDAAAATLASRGAPAPDVADHLVAGHTPPPIDSVSWLRRAAQEIWSAQPARAVTYLERAVVILGPLAKERDEVLLELVGPLTWADRDADAEAVAREVLAQATRPDVRRRAGIELALVLEAEGRLAEARRVRNTAAPDAATAEAVGDDPARVALALATLGRVALLQGDAEGLLRCAAAAARAAIRLDDDGVACTAGVLDSFVALADSDARAALTAADTALERGAGRCVVSPLAAAMVGLAALELDATNVALTAVQRGRGLAKHHGTRRHMPALEGVASVHALLTGRWDDLPLIQATTPGAALVHAIRAIVALQRGVPDTAELEVRASERSLAEHAQLGAEWSSWARGLISAADAKPRAAFDALRRCWTAHPAVRGFLTCRVAGVDLVRVALEIGDRETAQDVVRTLEMRAERVGAPSARSSALRAHGMLTGSIEAHDESVEVLLGSPCRYELALASADAAVAHAASADRDGAIVHADRALGILRELGATRAAHAFVAMLRTHGVNRPAPRVGATSACEGWESLTEAEAEVARLVAAGRSNREVAAELFVSRHTVDSHLRRIYLKLGIGSRVELAGLVAPRDGP
jgi:DNA-binding CsgD family transcriptional regulator